MAVAGVATELDKMGLAESFPPGLVYSSSHNLQTRTRITAKRTGPLKTKSADQPPRRAGASTSSANTILTLSSADDPDFNTFLNDNIFDWKKQETLVIFS